MRGSAGMDVGSARVGVKGVRVNVGSARMGMEELKWACDC